MGNKCCKTTFFVVGNFFNIHFVDPENFSDGRNFYASEAVFEMLKCIFEKSTFSQNFLPSLDRLKILGRGGWGSTLWDVGDRSEVC